MNSTLLTILRGKLTALETGWSVGVYEPYDLKAGAEEVLMDYPDMPAAERERAEALKLASEPARGLVL